MNKMPDCIGNVTSDGNCANKNPTNAGGKEDN